MISEAEKFALVAEHSLRHDAGDATARAIRRELEVAGQLPWKVVREHKATGASSQSVVIYENPVPQPSGAPFHVVEKRLSPGTGALADHWLDEALFYSRLAAEVRVPGMTIPRCLSIEVLDRRHVRLYLEHKSSFRPMRGLQERLDTARLFGQFAAGGVGDGHDHGWLHRSRGIGHVALPPTTDDLIDAVVKDPARRRAVRDAFLRFYARRDVLNERYRECRSTIAHGDANYLNVLVEDADPRRALVLDWARVNAGAVGDDLARLVYPWAVTHGEPATPEDVIDLEDRIVGSYVAGLGARADRDQLFGYELKSVVLTVGIAGTLMNWRAGSDTSQEVARRDAALHSLITVAADRASDLAGGSTTPSQRRVPMSNDQEQLTRRYSGTVASDYNKNRSRSPRWQKEHAAVSAMLQGYRGATVLDLPVGTGRFIPLYRELGCPFIGVDISQPMLDEASAEAARSGYQPQRLAVADAVTMDPADHAADVAVAVRFFNWLSAEAAERAFANIAASASRAFVLSLTTVDLAAAQPRNRPRIAASLDRAHSQPQKSGQPANGPHRWDHFQSWVLASGMELVESSVVFETENGLSNHIHLLRR